MKERRVGEAMRGASVALANSDDSIRRVHLERSDHFQLQN